MLVKSTVLRLSPARYSSIWMSNSFGVRKTTNSSPCSAVSMSPAASAGVEGTTTVVDG